MNTEQFLVAWRCVVAEWVLASAEDQARGRSVLTKVLEKGLASAQPAPGPVDVSDEQCLRCEIALIRVSGALDKEGYLGANPHIAERDLGPVVHFCRWGWQSLRNPNLDFDVWWYISEHLDPSDDRVNPFLYHLAHGQHHGLPTLPQRPEQPPARSLGSDRRVRRACLVAGYDIDSVVDDYVVAYVRELSRFADVFYLADGSLDASELDKLRPHTVGAWARPHGRYDFGSYSILASELIGWHTLERYDEVVFANDSAYLLRPLDEVFEQMDATACDWWGLQLTSRHFDGAGPGKDPLPLAEVKRDLPRAVWHYDYFPHIGSYFLAMRRSVIAEPGFRRRLEKVTTQRSKLLIIYKYETGLMYYLVGQGLEFSTFVDSLHPYHPIYSPTAFTLIGEGFPVLKRAFLVDNPYDTPDLVQWKQRVLEHLPNAPVDMLERNLLRVAADNRVRRSFSIMTQEDGSVSVPQRLTPAQMEEQDRRTPKYDHWWAFPVCAYDHTFAGNERAVFEEVRNDPSIKKIVLTRSHRVEIGGENVVVAPLDSPEGQFHVLRARQIFVKHAARINIPYPLRTTAHNFINLWHGIPLKRFGLATQGVDAANLEATEGHHQDSRAVVTSSKIDSLAMAAAFYPLTYQHMWPTGLPRNDFILRDEVLLPRDLTDQEQRLRQEVAGRRLLLFLPTFKDGQADSYYAFSDSEIAWLRAWCQQHEAVIGVREHMADRAHIYSQLLAPLGPINLSARRFPDIEMLYRVADGLVTDYSSCLVDFLLTGRPVISFAYDYERYANEERGLFYDLEQVLPGPVCRDFDQLSAALDHVFDERTPAELEEYAWRRHRFFDHLDDQNSRRVVHRVKGLYVREA